MADLPRSNMIKVRLFQKIKILKFDKMKSVQFFPLILWYFMFGIKFLIF